LQPEEASWYGFCGDDPVMLDLDKVRRTLRNFAAERDWEKFHSPKNLSIALAVEAAELLEIFQWLSDRQADEVVVDAKIMQRVREELADVFIYSIRLADRLNIDVGQAIADKIAKNAVKYPPDKSYGVSTKYDNL
jgi:dCTP diphosphatase